MDTPELLTIAKHIIANVPLCLVVTAVPNGAPNARVVRPGPLREDWSIGFMTERHCRKVREIEAAGQFAMVFQYDDEKAYVTLQGRPAFVDDIKIKRAVWSSESDQFHPGGPDDPNVVIIRLLVESVELYSASRGVQPAPLGLCSARLVRVGGSWTQAVTSPRSAA